MNLIPSFFFLLKCLHKSAGLHVEQKGERLSKTARVEYRGRCIAHIARALDQE